MLRIVFDTNVYISAALHGRLAETILQLAAANRVELVISKPILAEMARKLEEKLGWSAQQIDFFTETISNVAEVVEPEITLNVVPADEDDNRIVECAVAGEAALIITYDKDLLRLKSYETIGIIHPRQLAYYGLDAN